MAQGKGQLLFLGPAPAEHATPAPQTTSSSEETGHFHTSRQENNTNSPVSNPAADTFPIPSTYYFEGGVAAIELTDYGASANGGYLKLSLSPPQIHFLAIYQNPAKDVSITEIGIGSVSKHRFQLTSALTM